jgi:hypothetical protein
LDGILSLIQREMPGRLASQTRRAAIYICQSLRARTKKAPENIRPREYKAERVRDKAPYITKPDGQVLRRWKFTHLPGTSNAKSWIKYPYTERRRGANGRMFGGSKTAEIREMQTALGFRPIARRGLAKLSWGWVMKQIYGGAAAGDISWERTKGERRDPRRYVAGLFERAANGATAVIRNGLDYILDTLPAGALAAAMDAASKRLEHNILNNIERAAA